jgi:son of sevenless
MYQTFSYPHPPSPITIPKKQRKKWRMPPTELLKHEPVDIAEQLCLMEFALYRKITVQECLAWARADSATYAVSSGNKRNALSPSSSSPGSSKMGAGTDPRRPVQNLFAFCATHDKLVNWVKTTILMTGVLGRRADTIDFWIKVAEVCSAIFFFLNKIQ